MCGKKRGTTKHFVACIVTQIMCQEEGEVAGSSRGCERERERERERELPHTAVSVDWLGINVRER